MSNPNLEPKVKELMELKRMREELDAEIATIEDSLKQAICILDLSSPPRLTFSERSSCSSFSAASFLRAAR